MGSNKTLTVIDLFAGCGGLSLGLEQSGFNPIMMVELNSDARQSYLMNRQEQDILATSDIKEVVQNIDAVSQQLKDKHATDTEWTPDLIAGGPPCQGFSGIGHRRSYSVTKEQLPSNHLYQDMAFVISKLQPKMFLFENVRGLLTSKWNPSGTKGEIWEHVRKTFESLENYRVDWKLLFSKDYGVPQNRPRVILVGIRKDLDNNENLIPEPNGIPPTLQELWGDIIDPNYENGGKTTEYPSAPQNEIQRQLRGQEVKLTEHEYSKHSSKVMKKFQHMLNNNGEIPEEMKTKKFALRLLPPTWGKNGPNISVTSMNGDYVHFSQPRTLSVREWARLQMFPDSYRFAGPNQTGGTRRAGNPRVGQFDRDLPKYTQIGNAVPVELAKNIGNHLKKLIA